MASITVSDINFVLSGGTNNDSPEDSLGGMPSPTPISSALNNLFKNIDRQEAIDGKEDYRCIYVFNDHAENTAYNFSLFMNSPNDNNSLTKIYLGFTFANEEQIITMTPAEGSPPPASGSFRLVIGDRQTSLISYNSDNNILASSMQTALRNVLENGVDVIFTGLEDNVKIFKVGFYGNNKNKAFSILECTDNTILPVHTFGFEKTVIGSPINTVATEIEQENDVPNGISFIIPNSSGISLGTLRPGEGFPIWIKRIIPAFSSVREADGFKLRMRMTVNATAFEEDTPQSSLNGYICNPALVGCSSVTENAAFSTVEECEATPCVACCEIENGTTVYLNIVGGANAGTYASNWNIIPGTTGQANFTVNTLSVVVTCEVSIDGNWTYTISHGGNVLSSICSPVNLSFPPTLLSATSVTMYT
jgi:hypothetical protein